MKAILFSIVLMLTSALYSQTTINLPGEAGKTFKITGSYMGEMIRATGGEDKKKEHYYWELEGDVMTVWKHVIIIANGKTELLTITSLPIADLDWAYFESSNGEGPTEKKVNGKTYHTFGIYALRGKRFKQLKYTKETPSDVMVGNLEIHINAKDEANSFFAKVKSAQK